MASTSSASQLTTCFTCKIDFHGNKDAFVEHMSEAHAEDKVQCCVCQEISDSGFEYAMHFIYCHMEKENEKGNSTVAETLKCRYCNYAAGDLLDFNFHVATMHHNTAATVSNKSDFLNNVDCDNQKEKCPVCSKYFDANLLNDHVNDHFDDTLSSELVNPTVLNGDSTEEDSDYQLALELQRQEQETARKDEEKRFKDLQKEYGMDEQGSYKQQGVKACENAYNKGRMTLSQLYNEKARLQKNEKGIEDFNYSVKGLIERVHECSRRCPDILDTYTCSNVEYFGSCPADFGFGCGYRNIQMMISSLKQNESYRKALYGTGAVLIPSIPKIQFLIEDAWSKGFDAPGSEQLNGKLTETKKWIGATEACVFFMSFHIRAAVVDFRIPSGNDNTHPQLLKWVYEYFKEKRAFTPPLYCQHQGHSRTIIGVERTRSGRFNLLLFDPSAGKAKMHNIKVSEANSIKFLRKGLVDLKKPQFQIVYIKGIMENDEEYENFKTTMDVTKIPPL